MVNYLIVTGKCTEKILAVNPEKIMAVEQQEGGTAVILETGDEIVVKETMDEILGKLERE